MVNTVDRARSQAMPTNRYSKLAPETKRRLLDAARSEFIEHGYDDASLNRIIQAAGIHKGSLYYYFEDKADLFITVVCDAQEELIRSMTGGDLQHLPEYFDQRPPDFWEFMKATTNQKVAFFKSHPRLMRLFADLYRQAHRPGAPPAFKESYAQSRQGMLGFLKMGQAQGDVRTDLPDELIVDLGVAVSEVMNRQLLEKPDLIDRMTDAEIRRYAEVQLDMMKRMLSVAGPEDRGPRSGHVPEGGTKE